MNMASKKPLNIEEPTSEQIVRCIGMGKQVSSPEGPLTILDDINLEIERGDKAAIVGASGSGKSTLLGLMAGLDTPSSGRMLLDGHDLGALDEDGRADIRAGRVGFVFQTFQLLPGLTALENVMLPLELARYADPRNHARRVMEEVGLSHRLHHYPNQLSGGEQQRVALARAFSARPQILFADEPTGNLDRNTGARIIDLLFELNENHRTTLVLVTHDVELTRRCQQVYELDAGRLKGSM